MRRAASPSGRLLVCGHAGHHRLQAAPQPAEPVIRPHVETEGVEVLLHRLVAGCAEALAAVPAGVGPGVVVLVDEEPRRPRLKVEVPDDLPVVALGVEEEQVQSGYVVAT